RDRLRCLPPLLSSRSTPVPPSFPTRRSSDLCDPHGWVHSPVRGRHPNLAPSLRTFTKHFGGRRAAEAADMWAPIGKTTVHPRAVDRKSTRLNSSHVKISYAVFCLKKKKETQC